MNQEEIPVGKEIRKRRKSAHLTQEQLAKMAGISHSYLSKIEQGKINVSFGLLGKISKPLGLTMWDIITPQQQEEKPFVVVRKKTMSDNLASLPIQKPNYYTMKQRVEKEEMALSFEEFKPGEKSGDYYSHQGEEWHYIITGVVNFYTKVNGKHEECILNAGEFIHFRSETPHYVKNPGKKPARILTIRI